MLRAKLALGLGDELLGKFGGAPVLAGMVQLVGAAIQGGQGVGVGLGRGGQQRTSEDGAQCPRRFHGGQYSVARTKTTAWTHL